MQPLAVSLANKGLRQEKVTKGEYFKTRFVVVVVREKQTNCLDSKMRKMTQEWIREVYSYMSLIHSPIFHIKTGIHNKLLYFESTIEFIVR